MGPWDPGTDLVPHDSEFSAHPALSQLEVGLSTYLPSPATIAPFIFKKENQSHGNDHHSLLLPLMPLYYGYSILITWARTSVTSPFDVSEIAWSWPEIKKQLHTTVLSACVRDSGWLLVSWRSHLSFVLWTSISMCLKAPSDSIENGQTSKLALLNKFIFSFSFLSLYSSIL